MAQAHSNNLNYIYETMADNYLENQFEIYEAKKAAWQKKRKATGKKANSLRKESASEADTKDIRDNVETNEHDRD